MYSLLIVIHLICCLGLITIVLLQAGKGGGLSGAFGASAVETSLGAGASDVLKKGTTVLAVAFMLTSLGLAFMTAQRSASVVKDKITASTPAPRVPVRQEGGQTGGAAKGEFQNILKKITDILPGPSAEGTKEDSTTPQAADEGSEQAEEQDPNTVE